MAQGHSDETSSKTELLDRRTMLKLTGVAVTGLAATGSAAGATTLDVSEGEDIGPYLESVDDGETIQIPKGTYTFGGASISGQNWTVLGQGATFDVTGDETLNLSGSGWTFAGVEFNVKSGNVRALPRGSDWLMRNCAWNGPNDMGIPLVRPYVGSGSQAVIDSCWFGDGMGTRVGESAVKANSDGRGNYSIEGDLYVQRSFFSENGCYAAASADPGQPGRVHFDRCYFENAYLAAMRTGSLSGSCDVTNCVVNLTDESEVPETSTGASASRGIWAYWGEVVVEDCHIYTPGESALLASSSKDDASITARNCEVVGGINGDVTTSSVGKNPSRSPPDECVTGPKEAATGGTSDGSDTQSDAETHKLVIEGTGTNTEYEVSVDGELAPVTDTIESWDDTTSDSVRGWVTSQGSRDVFEFTGSITDVTFHSGEATVTVDGEPYSVNDSNQESGDSGSQRLVIEGTGTTTEYEVSVDGELTPVTDTIESWDETDNTSARGWVTSQGSRDVFEFTGSITDVTFHSGEATVTVDGEPYDGAGTSQELTIEGTGTTTEYEVSVDGELAPVTDTIESWDETDNTSARGWVTSQGSRDVFEFTGSITDVTFHSGEARVLVDGSEVDWASF